MSPEPICATAYDVPPSDTTSAATATANAGLGLRICMTDHRDGCCSAAFGDTVAPDRTGGVSPATPRQRHIARETLDMLKSGIRIAGVAVLGK